MGERLGQHFLTNIKAVTAAVKALDLRAGETVIEIGPGRGALTLPLVAACRRLRCQYIGLERDAELVHELLGELAGWPEAQIIHGDALREIPKLTNTPMNYKIVGNIPYYITGSLLRLLSELQHKPQRSVLMIQREVATRLSAKPGEMNLLAAATQVWAAPSMIMQLPPRDFSPPPKVHSSIIALATLEKQLPANELAQYYAALHIIFKQPRKTLLNNLAEALPKAEASSLIAYLQLPANARPHDLTLSQCRAIAERIGARKAP